MDGWFSSKPCLRLLLNIVNNIENKMLTKYWDGCRSGAWAGRGFRYQDAVIALLAVELWNGNLSASKIVPEGFDDVSMESECSSTLVQIKSRNECKKSFSNYEINKFIKAVFKRAEQIEAAGHKIDKRIILLERSPHNKNVQDLSEVSFEQMSISSTDEKGRYYIVTASNPKKAAMHIIQGRLSVVPSISEIVFHSIYAFVGYVASENAKKKYKDRYKITVSSMETLVTKIIKNVTIKNVALYTKKIE